MPPPLLHHAPGHYTGWEKGRVENQVGLVRERLFAPRPRFSTHDELNGWLADQCITYAKAHPHPERRDETIWPAFQAERASLIAYPGPFDGFHAVLAAVSKTCPARFDNNKYSVMAKALGGPVEVHAHAERIVIRQDGEVIAEHARCFGRGQTICDPWPYVPVLARKPGALRNGAPFEGWPLPAASERVRRKLAAAKDGDRQMVEILGAVLTDGIAAVGAACAAALDAELHSSDVILNILARQRQPAAMVRVLTPEALRLRHEPETDCARYDSPRKAG